MNQLLKKFCIIPSIYKGNFVDIDNEINLAYHAYPFPWPNEKPYEQYTREDVLQTLDMFENSLKQFIEQFGFDLDFFQGKVIVDLGAGIGWDSLCLARLGAKSVYAIDNSPTSLEHGQRFAKLIGLQNIQFCQHSLYTIDQISIKADVIIAKGVLHHIFDLSRFAKALSHITTDQTKILLTHSSYNSVPGFKHYFYNHLAWVLGGANREKRIDIGIKMFHGWHWQLPKELIRHRINDLTGVFYMARSAKQITKIFENENIKVQKIKGPSFLSLYLKLKVHHQKMFEIEKKSRLRKLRRLLAMSLLETFHFFSQHSVILNHFLGNTYKFLFEKPAHIFLAHRSKTLK